MRILTFNIHGWRTIDGTPDLDRVAAVLTATGADIIGLNEVRYPRAVAGSDRPALELLAERLGMHFVFGPCLRWPAQDDMPSEAFGNALLSRWPIIASSAHHLTPKGEDQQGLLAGKEQRGLLEGRILLPSQRTLTVYVTHLDHSDEAVRAIQLRVARTWLGRDRNRPHLLMGDFNTVSLWDYAGREHEVDALTAVDHGPRLACGAKGLQVVAQLEKAGYVDAYRRFGAPGERTFLPGTAALRVDYIFLSAPLADACTACVIVQDADGVSDHRPVLATLAGQHVEILTP